MKTTSQASRCYPPPYPILQGLRGILETLKATNRTGCMFGRRRLRGVPDWHNGIDLPATVGTLIRAPWDGVVSEAWLHKAGGLSLRVLHFGGETLTGYAHLSKYAEGIEKGKEVHAGDALAYVGMTGMTFGPHLHFRLALKQIDAYCDFDPMPFLEASRWED